MDNLQYMEDLVNELLTDESWDVSEDCKSMICWGLTRTLLDL